MTGTLAAPIVDRARRAAWTVAAESVALRVAVWPLNVSVYCPLVPVTVTVWTSDERPATGPTGPRAVLLSTRSVPALTLVTPV